MKQIGFISRIDTHKIDMNVEFVPFHSGIAIHTTLESAGFSHLSSMVKVPLCPRDIKELRLFLTRWENDYYKRNKHKIDRAEKIMIAETAAFVRNRDRGDRSLIDGDMELRRTLRLLSAGEAVHSLRRILRDAEHAEHAK